MDNLLRRKDLVENPTARVPVCLCLDVSGSMSGDPINELNCGALDVIIIGTTILFFKIN